jgi:hypothetical protein
LQENIRGEIDHRTPHPPFTSVPSEAFLLEDAYGFYVMFNFSIMNLAAESHLVAIAHSYI